MIDNIQLALQARRFPTITMYNRLETRPRAKNFNRALKAEVRDPLWMLCKQWQMGEFLGDDAGSPIKAKVHMQSRYLNKFQAREYEARMFSQELPLETEVEALDIPMQRGQQPISIDIRLSMGRQWAKMMQAEGLPPAYRQAFADTYSFTEPTADSLSDAPIIAHPEAWQQMSAIAGRHIDGGALYLHLIEDSNHRAYDGVIGIAPADEVALDDLALAYIAWYERLYYQGAQSGEDAWVPERLEYNCRLSAETDQLSEKTLMADEYYQGRMDWFNFDIEDTDNGLGDIEELNNTDAWTDTQEFIPTGLDYDGMPNTRWWAFEESKTNFGAIKPSTTDMGKLLFMEFGLVYANDWFMLPFDLPVGTLSQIKGISVTNVFGERIWVEAAGGGLDDDWSRWSMYSLSIRGDRRAPADTSLLLLPTVSKVLEADDKERILMVRDEMANMVWAVEQKIQLPTGAYKPGSEAATERRQFFEEQLGSIEPTIDFAAPVRYRVMNQVPEHWIPFVPVHIPGQSRQVQLQRAAMPRIIEGDDLPPVKVRPRTQLMRLGLDQAEPEAYFLHEDEVPRAGTQVLTYYQRCRWYGGKVVNWLGIRKINGRGEGSSGLAYDQLVPDRRTKLRRQRGK